jgi:hypothetical protein
MRGVMEIRNVSRPDVGGPEGAGSVARKAMGRSRYRLVRLSETGAPEIHWCLCVRQP